MEHPMELDMIDVDPTLNGPDFGQLVFDVYTKQLPRFDVESIQVFTGIGYVFTQAKDFLPYDMVPGTYHAQYNPDPTVGPKKKLYLGEYAFEDYFATKEFTPYPPCNNIIICDWNLNSINMILKILHAVPHVFQGKRITVVHGNILEHNTIETLRYISVKMQRPISAVYVTNIVNDANLLLPLFRDISPFDATLICDTMNRTNIQHVVHTRAGGMSRKRKRKRTRRII